MNVIMNDVLIMMRMKGMMNNNNERVERPLRPLNTLEGSDVIELE